MNSPKKPKKMNKAQETAELDDAPDLGKALDEYGSLLPAPARAAFRRRVAEDPTFASAAVAQLGALGVEVAKCAVLPDGDYEVANKEPSEPIAMADADLAAMARFYLVDYAKEIIADMGLPAHVVQGSALERLKAVYEKHAAASKKTPAKRARTATKKASPAKPKAGKAGVAARAEKPADSDSKTHAGKGCWVARTMEIEWPGREPDMIEAVGIYNTVTKEFKLHETVGEALEKFVEDNPDQDYDELLAIYEREARDWANSHNTNGW